MRRDGEHVARVLDIRPTCGVRRRASHEIEWSDSSPRLRSAWDAIKKIPIQPVGACARWAAGGITT
jgi:hypothetical protein